MKREKGYYWLRLPNYEWLVGEWKKVNAWDEPDKWAFICRELFNEGRGVIDDNVVFQLKIEINETRIPAPDEEDAILLRFAKKWVGDKRIDYSMGDASVIEQIKKLYGTDSNL